MSILDGLPSTEAEMAKMIGGGAAVLEAFLAKADLGEKQREAIELYKQGVFLGEIMGITKEHKDAILAKSLTFIQLGERVKARDLLLQLYLFDPLYERTVYAMALSYQLDGDFSRAAKLYVQFLALDATNPDGHLRLGECLLAAQELDDADGCFKTARSLATSAGHLAAAAHAAKMLEVVVAKRAEASPH